MQISRALGVCVLLVVVTTACKPYKPCWMTHDSDSTLIRRFSENRELFESVLAIAMSSPRPFWVDIPDKSASALSAELQRELARIGVSKVSASSGAVTLRLTCTY